MDELFIERKSLSGGACHYFKLNIGRNTAGEKIPLEKLYIKIVCGPQFQNLALDCMLRKGFLRKQYNLKFQVWVNKTKVD